MGNCSRKPKVRTRSSRPPADPSPPAVQLHGSETSPIAWRIRVALLYKLLDVDFIESRDGEPFIRCGSETVTGSEESLLRYIDKRFGGPPAAGAATETDGRGMAVEMMLVQHRSILQHVEGMARWAEKMTEEAGDGWRGKAADGRRMARFYGELVEIMLEHAQMEERFLFPALDRSADYDVCRTANEEHGRDLPLMNGIKEDIESCWSPYPASDFTVQDKDLLDKSVHFVQEHCKQHFEDEERELLPLLEAAESVRRRAGEEKPGMPNRWVQQMVDLMEQTHSRLFSFFAAALLPREALRYVGLVSAGDDQRAIAMLRSIAVSIETSSRPSLPHLYKGCN
ncbi:uncharacterized protein LOC110035914 [Phalaenopsis equestris]|uniref:uncharacterized protein LOC110035914 n=1 Tax=Phalaenopsis equestris TaxID=78828 RepID=UPI0009E2D7E4|nr:uncharacterized protein LOC110035914 [Phalaenopsis equestris]